MPFGLVTPTIAASLLTLQKTSGNFKLTMRFLTTALVTLGLAFVNAFPHDPVTVSPANPNDPLTLAEPKSVLVIGGGLAGLSAALELSQRGYQVHIREALETYGGRLKVRTEHLATGTFQVEHGIPVWFNNYHNLKDIRDRLNVNDNFQSWDKVDYVFRTYKPEQIYSEGPYPLNLLGIVSRSPNLSLTDAIKSILALPDLTFYNYDNVWRDWDNITFIEWAQEKHVPQNFYDIIMDPALSVTLNDRTTLSAAEILTYIQLYFLSDPNADKREVANVDHGTAILHPWADQLTANGATFTFNSPVPGLVFENNQVLHPTDEQNNYDWVVLASDLKGVQSILGNSQMDEASTATTAQLIDNVQNHLTIAPEYKILRVWLDGQPQNRPEIVETPQHSPINLIAQYHMLEKEFIDWGNKTGGSVLEFHLYDWTLGEVADADVWTTIRVTASQVWPELANFKMLAYAVKSYNNFPSFNAGSHMYRPFPGTAINSGISNLVFAGDWLATDYPCALMEKAVTTGREAANIILLADGVQQVSMVVNSKYGPGIL
jgi:isorenieratene synthase